MPRSIRRKTREITAAREAFQRASGRAPEDRELAEQLNVDLETLWRWQADVEGAHHIPLDRAPGERENTTPVPAEVLTSGEESGVEDSLTHEQEVSHLKDAILRLKEQERIVLSLYYFEEPAARNCQGARTDRVACLADPQQGAEQAACGAQAAARSGGVTMATQTMATRSAGNMRAIPDRTRVARCGGASHRRSSCWCCWSW